MEFEGTDGRADAAVAFQAQHGEKIKEYDEDLNANEVLILVNARGRSELTYQLTDEWACLERYASD
jgi:hypothetical protein